MKRFQIIFCSLVFCLISNLCIGQTDSTVTGIPDSLALASLDSVDFEAGFPGGAGAWKKHLQKNLNATVPHQNGAPSGIYRVVVKFLVTSEGKVENFSPETKWGFGMEKEVIRVIKKGPRWSPAIRNGQKVSSYKSQSVIFVYTKRN